MSLIPAGFTRLDNETDVATLLSLPNALVQPYLFLLTRARLTRPAAHWGEVAAAIGRGQTQTHNALRQLKALGLATEEAGLWLGTRREAAQESGGNPADVCTETRRKPAINAPEINVLDGENPTPKEGTEGKKEQKERNNPPTPQGGEAQNTTAPGQRLPGVSSEILEPETTPPENPNSTTPDGVAAGAAVTDLNPPQDFEQAPQEAGKTSATNKKNVPGRAAAKFDPLALALPEGVPADVWAQWVDHRQEIKKPMTQAAAVLTLSGLKVAHEHGWDVTEMIHEAITHRWIGCVFDKHRQPNPRPAHVVAFTPSAAQTENPDEYDMEALFAAGTAFGNRPPRRA